MADITFTAASVKPGVNAVTIGGMSGATVTQGLLVYSDADDSGDYKLADCTSTTATATCVGVALSSGADGQPCVIQTSGYLTCDNLTANTVYVLSAAGKPCPAADYSAVTDYLTVIGVAVSTTSLKLGINCAGTGKTG